MDKTTIIIFTSVLAIICLCFTMGKIDRVKDEETPSSPNPFEGSFKEGSDSSSNNNANQITTASGLKYEILKKGTGKSPKATSQVEVYYRGTLLDGTEFDSSTEKTITFPLNRVIKGWTEGLQLMKEGAKWKFTIPSELAYGSQEQPKIPANSTLIFEIELIKVLD